MKYSQEYTFQRSTSDIPSGVSLLDHTKGESFFEMRIKSLELKVESLEKQLKLYEQMYNLKSCGSSFQSSCDFDEEPIKEIYRRIGQLEEYYSKISTNNYPLSKIDIDMIINEKLSQEQMKNNLKLNDVSLKIKDLSQHKERQQVRFTTFQDSLIHINKHLTENGNQIKELNSQMLSIREMFTDNSKEEELFLRNISNNNTHKDDVHY